MECPVCYEDCHCLKLVCGHAICKGCVKEWTLKGCNDGCPMCRKPLYFKGFQDMRKQIRKERTEARYTETLDSIFGEVIESFYEDEEELPMWVLMEDIKDIETTFNVLKSYRTDPEDIVYWILDEGLYMSERGQKWEWDDEPVKEVFTSWRPSHQCVV